jgi:hypothetical protein
LEYALQNGHKGGRILICFFVLVHTDHASPPLTFGLSSLEDHPSERYMDRTPHLDSSLGLIEGKSRAPWSLNLLNLDLDLHRHLVCPANQKGNSYLEITSSLDLL